MPERASIVILGVFVADTSFRAARQPRMGETLLGSSFALGPGGKGSNQSVAAGRLGANVSFITKLGDDAFGAMARDVWAKAGVKPAVIVDPEGYTGAAFIFIEEASGNNAIIISPGAAATISVRDVEAEADLIRSASIFITQLEQPLDAAVRALAIARSAGVQTILNPAPGRHLDDEILALCDYLTPNETEAFELTGIEISSVDDARRAADRLLERGVGAAIVTLGEKGALYHAAGLSEVVPAVIAGPLVETTGAGDAFNAGFAVALAEGRDPVKAVRFGCAVAGISVTRPGAAASMPSRAEVDRLLAR